MDDIIKSKTEKWNLAIYLFNDGIAFFNINSLIVMGICRYLNYTIGLTPTAIHSSSSVHGQCEIIKSKCFIATTSPVLNIRPCKSHVQTHFNKFFLYHCPGTGV